MTRTPKTKTDLEVLAPSPVEVYIGDRTFIQEPLTLRGTACLISAVAEEIENVSGNAALGVLLDQDLAGANSAALVPVAIKVLSSIPGLMARVITIILTGEEKVDDLEYIDAKCRLTQAMKILRTFIEQNEPEELVENFIVLRSTLSTALSRAQEKVATEA